MIIAFQTGLAHGAGIGVGIGLGLAAFTALAALVVLHVRRTFL